MDERLALGLAIARALAGKAAGKAPSYVDKEAVLGAAHLGVARALETYDAKRGVVFKAWCVLKVKSAISDELRSQDWLPRPRRQKAQVDGLLPEEEKPLSLDVVGDEPGDRSLLDQLAGTAMNPEQCAIWAVLATDLENAVAKLPEREREVCRRTFWMGEKDRETGEAWGVSISRVRQIRWRALKRLKKMLSWWPE